MPTQFVTLWMSPIGTIRTEPRDWITASVDAARLRAYGIDSGAQTLGAMTRTCPVASLPGFVTRPPHVLAVVYCRNSTN